MLRIVKKNNFHILKRCIVLISCATLVIIYVIWQMMHKLKNRNITEGDEYPHWAGAWQYTYVWEIQGAITHLKIIPVQHADNMHN